MRNVLSLLALLAGFGAFSVEAADLRNNILAPYRFQPAPKTLDPVDRGKAQLYQNQLDTQSRSLELDRNRGKLDLRDNSLRLDTQKELRRMDDLLQR